MQLRYVFSETATGLRRNVSMTVALVVTIFVSLTLVGVGLLLNAQAPQRGKRCGRRDRQRRVAVVVRRKLPRIARLAARLSSRSPVAAPRGPP